MQDMRPAGDNGRRRVGRHYSPRIALSPHCFHPRDARCTPWWITGRGADQRAATGDISVGRRIGSVRRSRSSRVLLVRRKRDDRTPYGDGPQCRFSHLKSCINSTSTQTHDSGSVDRRIRSGRGPSPTRDGDLLARAGHALPRQREHRSQRRARLREQSAQYHRARRAGLRDAAVATDPRG